MEKALEDIGDEMLSICSFTECARIKVDDELEKWISRDDNPELYDRYIEAYRDMKLSHGYCPRCYEGVKRDFGVQE